MKNQHSTIFYLQMSVDFNNFYSKLIFELEMSLNLVSIVRLSLSRS